MKLLLTAALGSPYPKLAEDLLEKDFSLILVDSAVDENNFLGENILIRKVNWLGDGYFGDITRIIAEEKPDFYIPMLDEEIAWAHNNVRTKILSPSHDFCIACLNKEDLIQYLRDLKISVVKTWVGNLIDKFPVQYPCIVKPIFGRGSRGFCKIENPAQYDAYLTLENRSPYSVLRQEYLVGPEYTVSVVVNNKNQLMAIVPKLVQEKRGITIRAVTEKNDAIHRVCEEIVQKMHPCGTFNVQLKMMDGVPKIFEINPRLSTTSILTTEAGINEIDLMIKYWDADSTPFFQFKEGIHLYRRWENIFYE
jgi:carbamoyl-phosphate synthase large subunit